jgi:AraC family transcriptional regulator of arabinose operon
LSPSRLSHLFKAETGISVQRYLETARMRHAAELLRRTSFSIKQIAAAVGFPDPLYFSQRFRVFTEASPTDYREKAASLNGL